MSARLQSILICMMRFSTVCNILTYCLIGCAVMLTAVRIALYLLSSHPQFLADKIGTHLERSVRIGSVSAHLHYFQPRIVIRDVEIVDESESTIFSLDELALQLRVFSFKPLTPSILKAHHAKFSLSRDAQGEIFVQGFQFSGDSKLASLFANGQFQLNDSEISWVEQTLVQPAESQTLKFQHVALNLVSKHGDFRFQFTTSPNPEPFNPIELGSGQIEFIGELNKTGAGPYYLAAADLQLQQALAIFAPELVIRQAAANVELWGTLSNSQLASLGGSLSLDDIVWNADISAAKQLALNFWLDDNSAVRRIALDQLSLNHALVDKDLQIGVWQPRQPDQGTDPKADDLTASHPHYHIRMSQFQLQSVVAFLETLHPDSVVGKILPDLKLQGQLNNVELQYQAASSKAAGWWSACGDFTNLQADYANYAALMGDWKGGFCANPQTASLTLDAHDVVIKLPTLYRSALSMEALNGTVRLDQQDQGWFVSSDKLSLHNADLAIDTQFNLKWPTAQAALLDAEVAFEINQAANIGRYLPGKTLDSVVTHWISNAFRSGSIIDGHYSYHGLLEAQAFEHGTAFSKAAFKLDDTRIQFHPDNVWPELEHFNADIAVENTAVNLTLTSGRSQGVRIDRAEISIDDLNAMEAVLIDTSMSAPLHVAEAYIGNSPLEISIGPIIHFLQPKGDAIFNLLLNVPLLTDTEDESLLDGSVDFLDARLNMTDIDLQIDHLKGRLNYNEDTVFSDLLNGELDGKALQLMVKDAAENIIVEVETEVDTDFLTQRWPWLAALDLQGETHTDIQLDISKNSPIQSPDMQLFAKSDLLGMQVVLPAPLGKTAMQPGHFAIQVGLNEASSMPLKIDYATDTQLLVNLQQQDDDWQVQRAQLLIGEGVFVEAPETGITVQMNLPHWDLAALKPWADRLSWSSSTPAPSSTEPAFSESPTPESAPQLKYLTMHIAQLDWEEIKLGKLELEAQNQQDGWRLQLDGDIAQGSVDYFPVSSPSTASQLYAPTGQLKIALDSLQLPAFNFAKQTETAVIKTSETSTSIRAEAAPVVAPELLPDPNTLPKLDITINQLVWKEQQLGAIQLKTGPGSDGLIIESLQYSNEEQQFSASGEWIKQQGETKTSLQGELKSKNLAHLLQQFDLYQDIRKTAAEIEFDVDWQAPFHKIDFATLDGSLSVKLEDGRLLGIEPGIGRALGLFSLNAWQRRLRLDFSDVVDDGFAYESAIGHFDIYQGDAFTDGLDIDGVSARVKISGRFGLAQHDFDNTITVVPRSSIALPLVGAAAGGPIGIGAGLFAQQLVGDQFDDLSSTEYALSGPWNNSTVTATHENGGVFSQVWWELQKLTGME